MISLASASTDRHGLVARWRLSAYRDHWFVNRSKRTGSKPGEISAASIAGASVCYDLRRRFRQIFR